MNSNQIKMNYVLMLVLVITLIAIHGYLVLLTHQLSNRNQMLQDSVDYLEQTIEHKQKTVNRLMSKNQEDREDLILKSNLLEYEIQNLHVKMEHLQSLNRHLLENIKSEERKKVTLPVITPKPEKLQQQEILLNQLQSLEKEKVENQAIPILILTCNRAFYLEKVVGKLIHIRNEMKGGVERHPIIISRDCEDQWVQDLVSNYTVNFDGITMLRQPNQTAIMPYEAITRHFGWALNQVFGLGFKSAIVLEDDLEPTTDFLNYFNAMYNRFLFNSTSESLFCVSAWNDLGEQEFLPSDLSQVTSQFKRTDFFPGLGWMLTSEFWKSDLQPNWPTQYWDEYLRRKNVAKERQCIYPVVPRVKYLGKLGTSGEEVYQKHLSKMVHYNNATPLDYKSLDLSYLSKDQYAIDFQNQLDNARQIQFYEIESFMLHNQTVKITYKNEYDFTHYANLIGLMGDSRESVPRSSYNGTVNIYYKSNQIYFIPHKK